jgi:hypothetical protein
VQRPKEHHDLEGMPSGPLVLNISHRCDKNLRLSALLCDTRRTCPASLLLL